jgi:outer membrane protein OmpA-like peptidoglycan-associated protein
MNKLILFGVAASIFMSGCTKKKTVKKPVKSKKISSKAFIKPKKHSMLEYIKENKDIPLYTSSSDDLLMNDDSIANLAFVDEDFQQNQNIASVTNDKSQEMIDEIDSVLSDNTEDILVDTEKDTTLTTDNDFTKVEFKKVQFDFNQNNIRNDQKDVIAQDCKLAQKTTKEGGTLVVHGHTCQMGSASYNLALSQKRANAVKKEMIKDGIPDENIKTVGFGYESPIEWTDETDRKEKIKALAANRRAEIFVQ